MLTRVDLIKKSLKGKVLDVGYNVSTLHSEIKEKYDTVAIDICIKKPETGVIKADAEHLSFKAQTFNSIVAGELIEHLKTPKIFFEESYRVLKKEGTLILTTPNVDSLINRLFKPYFAPAHLSLFNKKTLSNLLEKSKFTVNYYKLFPYTQESSEGSTYKWFYAVRKILHYFLPKSLQEEMFIIAKKI